jgi:hypothetical protein
VEMGLRWTLKNGQKPPNLEMYDFVAWEPVRVGSCVLFIFWREKERDTCFMYVFGGCIFSTERGDAVELGVNRCDSRHLTSRDVAS